MTKKTTTTTTTNEKTMQVVVQSDNATTTNENAPVMRAEITNGFLLEAIAHFDIKKEDMEERDAILDSENAYGGWLYIRLVKEGNDLQKQVDKLAKKIKKDGATKAEKDFYKQQKESLEDALKDVSALKGNIFPLVEKSISREICIVAYGAGKCDSLRIEKEEMESILKNCTNIARYGKNHIDMLKIVAENKTPSATHTEFYKSVKKEMQTIYNKLLPSQSVKVRGHEIVDLCNDLCNFYTSQSNGGKTEQGYKYTSGARVLKHICQYLTTTINKMAVINVPDFEEKEEKQEEAKQEQK